MKCESRATKRNAKDNIANYKCIQDLSQYVKKEVKVFGGETMTINLGRNAHTTIKHPTLDNNQKKRAKGQ